MSTPSTEPRLSHPLLPVLIPVLAGIALYSRAIYYPFTNWDDLQFVVLNPHLQSPTWASLLAIFTPGEVPGEMLYVPVTYLSFMAERVCFELTAMVVHLDNVILHAINIVLVFYLATKLGLSRWVASTVALAFTVHPLQVEAVAWAMGRKDLLGALFALASIIAFFHYRAIGRRSNYILTLLLFCLSCLSKPAFLVLPLVYSILERIPGRGHRPGWRALAPFYAVALAVYLVNVTIPVPPPESPPTLVKRAEVGLVAAGDWAQRILLLERPCPIYEWPKSTDRLALGLGIVCILGFAAIYHFLRKQKWTDVKLALVVGLVAALPAMTVVMSGRDFVTADRYGYFPMVGLFLALAFAAGHMPPVIRRAYGGIVFVWLGFSVVSAHHQVNVWQDDVSLWENVLRVNPNNPLAYSNLGMAYVDGGKPAQAVEQFQAGIAANPNYAPLYVNLGRTLLDMGRADDALAALQTARQHRPNSYRIAKNMGDCYAHIGQFANAERYYRQALDQHPEYDGAWSGLGQVQYLQHQSMPALASYERALQLAPNRVQNHYNLGILYKQTGEVDKAQASYERAIELEPNHLDARFNLANLHEEQKRLSEAEAGYLELLRRNPQHVEALINVGNVFLLTKRPNQALSAYLRALSLAPDRHPGLHINLARLYVAAGDLERAREHLEKAKANQTKIPDELREQLLRAPTPVVP